MAGHRNYIRLPEGKVEFKQRLSNLGVFASSGEMHIRNVLGERLGESRGDRWWAARMEVFSRNNCQEFFGWDGMGEKPEAFAVQTDFNAHALLEIADENGSLIGNSENPAAAQADGKKVERLPNGVPLIDRETFKGRKRISFLQEIEWVRQHYMLKGLQAKEAPTPWCWSQVQEIQKDPIALRTFTEVFVAKLNPTKKEQEEAEGKHGDADGQEHYMQRLKAAYCEATGQPVPEEIRVEVIPEGEL